LIYKEDEFFSKDLKKRPGLAQRANLILTMTKEQIDLLLAYLPKVDPRKVHVWLEFAGQSVYVEDPCGKGKDGSSACLRVLDRSAPMIMAKILKEFS